MLLLVQVYLSERLQLLRSLRDGTATPDTSPPQLGNSVGRLRLDGSQLTTVDFFTPHDHADLTSMLAAHLLFEGSSLLAMEIQATSRRDNQPPQAEPGESETRAS